MRWRFHAGYFLLMLLLLIAEIFIALYISDDFIRPYFGDMLVVILIYCFVKSFADTPVIPTATAVLFLAFVIEFLQYLHIIDRLGWRKYKIANLVMGNLFQWLDLVMYTAGILLVIIIERYRSTRSQTT
jgi:hypothetical protein